MMAQLQDTLIDLALDGGWELAAQGAKGIKRQLIIDLETSGPDPEMHEIIRYHAVNRWDEDDEFDEWAKGERRLSAFAEQLVGVTNQQLDLCRASADVLADFLDFIQGAELVGHGLAFLEAVISRQ